ncbi:Imidazole glycerol phosphate synthase subunit HisH [bioreactor metagenome]|uniref:Imidazole glycerol phosphate synthase subunit HisH n=1 Tax=bioreactor metagenome TaxID=1076179 RepID=A0A645C289_9ZZZZ|nr:imidazole glycerol phosphate synthase subunit HisH [Rikenellaceae bacterium]
MIAILDYGAGNLFSLGNAINRVGAEYIVTSRKEELAAASHIILPGVGDASQVISRMDRSGLVRFLVNVTKPVLGICVGMQVMCDSSEEGDAACAGIFAPRVRKLREVGVKVPHMGWNQVYDLKSPLFKGVNEGEWFYFVHSYAPLPGPGTIAKTTHGSCFASALNIRNFYGTQFHPEKSGTVGERVLRNFFELK